MLWTLFNRHKNGRTQMFNNGWNSGSIRQHWKLGNCIYKYTYRKCRCFEIENPSFLFLPCKKEENTSLFQKLEKTQQTRETVITSMLTNWLQQYIKWTILYGSSLMFIIQIPTQHSVKRKCRLTQFEAVRLKKLHVVPQYNAPYISRIGKRINSLDRQ